MKHRKHALLAAFVILPAALFASSAFADSSDSDRPEPPTHSGARAPFFGTGVTRTAVNTDDGAVVTIVSADADAVAKIQAFDWAKEWSFLSGATATVATTDAGVTVTVTSADSSVVTKIQEMAARQPGKGRREGMSGSGSERPEFGSGSGSGRPEFGSGSERPEFGSGSGSGRPEFGSGSGRPEFGSGASDTTNAKKVRHAKIAKQLKSRLDNSLSAIDKLSDDSRAAVYAKLITKVDALAAAATSSGDASSAEIYAVLKDVLQARLDGSSSAQ